MKESEFIELLNLYVDHEIGAADAARLETEVMSDPARRRIYRQYCSMDKACNLLATQFGETAAKAVRIEPRAPQRNWVSGFYATGLLAAACVAALLVVRMRSGSLVPAASAPAAVAAAVQPAVAAPSSAEVAVYDRPLQTVLAVHNLSLNASYPAIDAVLSSNGQNDPLAWMKTGSLPPLQVVPVNFQTSPALLVPGAFPVQSSGAQQGDEQAAFRFQR